MAPKRRLAPQSVWDEPALRAAFAAAEIKDIHVQRIYKHLMRFPDAAWDSIPDLPKNAISLLSEAFMHSTSKVVQAQHSADGQTTKLLLQLQDGLTVESVIMHYDTSGVTDLGRGDSDADSCVTTGGSRVTLCVSSEVGCQMGCTFCATGTMGLKGDLTSGEIIEQLVHARALTPIRNVVFMGMGEPLNNYNEVRPAVHMMTDTRFFGMRRSAVTVSTVGVIPRILQMADDLPGVSLALSLHAPNQSHSTATKVQELRKRIVPSAAAYKLDKLMAAIDTYQQRTRQRVFMEYVMLRDVNDGPEQAHELGKLLQGRDVVQNLIPWNPVYSPSIKFQAPDPERINEFHRILRQEYGIPCTVRQEKGQDISGACGQLVVETQSCNGSGKERRPMADIEEFGRRRVDALAG